MCIRDSLHLLTPPFAAFPSACTHPFYSTYPSSLFTYCLLKSRPLPLHLPHSRPSHVSPPILHTSPKLPLTHCLLQFFHLYHLHSPLFSPFLNRHLSSLSLIHI